MKNKFKIGDIVRLSYRGIETLKGIHGPQLRYKENH